MNENNQPRLLHADEIDARVKTWDKSNKAWAMILLYKDARVDQKLMDETYGVMNWKRSHELIDGNLYCTVSVWNEKAQQWVSKQDVGTESDTEKEKGQASDSFKRACFNWGIGRELYTAPSIFVNTTPADYDSAGKFKTRLTVSAISYNDNREITALELKDSKGVVRYQTGASTAAPKAAPKAAAKAAKTVKPAAAPKTSVSSDILPEGYDDLQFVSIIKEIGQCQSQAALKQLHQQHPALATYAPFRNALNARFTKVPA